MSPFQVIRNGNWGWVVRDMTTMTDLVIFRRREEAYLYVRRLREAA